MWIWFKKMMKNSYLEIEYLMTKIGDDTAEKKPPKKSSHWYKPHVPEGLDCDTDVFCCCCDFDAYGKWAKMINRRFQKWMKFDEKARKKVDQSKSKCEILAFSQVNLSERA